MALIRKRRLTDQQQRRIASNKKTVKKNLMPISTLKAWWCNITDASLKCKSAHCRNYNRNKSQNNPKIQATII